uniref:Protein sleepless n=1 Tax=Panagrolaimus sp. JU765 TaxID=591449 RepID=A0AC34PW43_9BILA
ISESHIDRGLRPFNDPPNWVQYTHGLCCVVLVGTDATIEKIPVKFKIQYTTSEREGEYGRGFTQPGCKRGRNQVFCCCAEDMCNSQNYAVQQFDHLRTKDQTSPTALPVVMLVMTIFLSTFFTAMIGTISYNM